MSGYSFVELHEDKAIAHYVVAFDALRLASGRFERAAERRARQEKRSFAAIAVRGKKLPSGRNWLNDKSHFM